MHSPDPVDSTGSRDRFSQFLALTAAAACVGLLAYKFLLTAKLNVNWDEFYYLNHVHAAARGELNLLLNGSYTHLFGWLTRLDADEMGQIVAARVLMVALLCVTAWLVWCLARNWVSGFPALVASFVYLSCMPVLVHGGSFRSDSLLAPLTMAALVLLARPGSDGRRDWCAGVLLGTAFAVTIKAALFAPLVALLIVFRPYSEQGVTGTDTRDKVRALARVSLAAAAAAALIILAHWFTVTSTATETAMAFGARTASKTLFEVPWFPRLDYLHRYVRWQPLPWLLFMIGTLAALARRRFDLASLSLALLPLAIYRNAFPYYYIVMLAPVSVLAAFAVQEMRDVVRRWARMSVASLLVAVIWLGLLYQGLAYADRLWFDDQLPQRQLVAAVHQVFPEPVNYVDRCGMIASFRKVNFFMSTWGMDNYRNRGQPFMPAAIRDHRPAFVLVNSSALNPNRPERSGLMGEDQELIARFYPRYWGPLRVAGASVTLQGTVAARVLVPFPGDYRIVAAGPIQVDGTPRQEGDVISVAAEGVSIAAAMGTDPDTETKVRLYLATARPAPQGQLLGFPLFVGL